MSTIEKFTTPTLEDAFKTVEGSTTEGQVSGGVGNNQEVEGFDSIGASVQDNVGTEKESLLVSSPVGDKLSIDNSSKNTSYGPPLGDTKAGDEDTSPGNIARGILREKQEGDLPKD
jgi:hypothetical protein